MHFDETKNTREPKGRALSIVFWCERDIFIFVSILVIVDIALQDSLFSIYFPDSEDDLHRVTRTDLLVEVASLPRTYVARIFLNHGSPEYKSLYETSP